MRHMINGREYEIPTRTDGSIDSDDIRRAANIPSDRPLVLKGSDGGNQIVNPGEKIQIGPGNHFADMPVHRRGD